MHEPLRPPARALLLATALAAVFATTGCSRGTSPPVQTGQGERGNLSAAELRYGVSATRDSSVTYQDDVVIFDHGADIIHSVSPDGITWAIDANDPHARDLIPGKIAFITNRAVGRVLGTQRTGNELSVTLGPVALTDIIKQGKISFSQPLDLSSMTSFYAPDFPGAVVDMAPSHAGSPPSPLSIAASGGAQEASVRVVDSTNYWYAMPALADAPALPPIDIKGFTITPFCCTGIGVQIKHDSGGIIVLASAVLWLASPSISCTVEITPTGVKTAALDLYGAAGLTLRFEVASPGGLAANISKEISVPVDLTKLLPATGLAIPFATTLQNSFILKTAFTSRNSTLKAIGDYSFSGAIHMGYSDGHWSTGAPTSFTVKQSLLDSINGVSLGAAGLVMAYHLRLIVGLGAFGFTTGPYLGYSAGIGIVNGAGAAALAGPPCHAATLDTALHVGVGYSIPTIVADVINFFLRSVHLAEIKPFGGPSIRAPLQHLHEARPLRCG